MEDILVLLLEEQLRSTPPIPKLQSPFLEPLIEFLEEEWIQLPSMFVIFSHCKKGTRSEALELQLREGHHAIPFFSLEAERERHSPLFCDWHRLVLVSGTSILVLVIK